MKTYLFKDEGERGIITADASDGRLQRQKAVFLYSRRDLARKTTSVLKKKRKKEVVVR